MEIMNMMKRIKILIMGLRIMKQKLQNIILYIRAQLI